MATISRITTWSSLQVLTASALNGEFNNIVNTWNNHNSGSSLWGNVYATNATSVPLLINNGAGTNNVANFQSNGTNVFTIANGGVSTFTCTGGSNVPLTINNGASSGDILVLQANGTTKVEANSAGNMILANNTQLQGRSSGGTAGTLIFRDSSDNLIVGDTAFNNPLILQIGNNYMSFSTNSSEAMRILNTGSVGIGLTAPGAQLHVKATTNEVLRLESTQTTGPFVRFYTASAALKWTLGHDLSQVTGAFVIRDEANSDNTLAILKTSVICGSAAVATNATDGFLYIATCAGTPTGTPTARSGRAPLVYDSSNNKLYVYNSAWRGVTLS